MTAAFNLKQWLDDHVVPVAKADPKIPLTIHASMHNGSPPKEILVFLLAGHEDPEFDETHWPQAVKRLLEAGFKFDFTREVQLIPINGAMVPIFGGDGTPLISPTGMASVRLFRKFEDGVGLVLQVGCQYKPAGDHSAGHRAAAGVKTFFALFEKDPVTVCQTFSAPFGQA